MIKKPKIIALVPARSGSKRVQDKNIKKLADHPLIAYTIRAAIDSQIFDRVIVSTDSKKYADIAAYYGGEIPFLRPPEFAGDMSPDIEWVTHTIKNLNSNGYDFDGFSILRPTSPFRQSETICRAYRLFVNEPGIDSLRAVEKCKQHPGKMWMVQGNRMNPLMPFQVNNHPWHSCQYPMLPEIYVQNASLEMAWNRVVYKAHTISGNIIMPFFTEGLEGFDINLPEDWDLAENWISSQPSLLPKIQQPPFKIEYEL